MNASDPVNGLCFVDTNIWLYAFIAAQDQGKTARAGDLIRQSEIVVSTQVINEVSVNLIKKAGFDEPRIRQLIGSFYSRYLVVSPERSELLKASELRQRYQFSYWDSLIVACALSTGAEIIYSEDMDTGLLLEHRLRIVNPLTAVPE
jgi:predicted nucleic acid-binding protein